MCDSDMAEEKAGDAYVKVDMSFSLDPESDQTFH